MRTCSGAVHNVAHDGRYFSLRENMRAKIHCNIRNCSSALIQKMLSAVNKSI
jgi:hypothetical protein